MTCYGWGNIVKNGNSSLNVASPYDNTNKNNHFSSSVTTITYDNMGDITKDDLGNTYGYDSEGRPVTVNGISTLFDAFNRAVEQNRSGATTQIVYSPTGEKFSFMNGQTLKSYFLPMAGGLQVVYNSSGLQYFRQVDWLGSGRFATDKNGNVYYDAAYGPWGEPFNETGTNDRLFTDQTQDTTGGIYDFMFRQHSPTQGRWLTPDPSGLAAVDITNPQTWNRYSYTANTPLTSVDLLGLQVVCYGNPEIAETVRCEDVIPHDGHPAAPGPDELWTIHFVKWEKLRYTQSNQHDSGGMGVAANNCISPGVCQSKIDNLNPMEKGKTNYRDPFSICSTHTTVDNSTGATSSHVDLFNPGTSIPTGPMTGNIPALPFHLLFDALPDAIYNLTGHYLLPARRGLCQ